MNSKKCKRLRRLAEDLTIGEPQRSYIPQRQAGNSTRIALTFDPKAHPNYCTRGVYRMFKKLGRRNNPDEAQAYLSKFAPSKT